MLRSNHQFGSGMRVSEVSREEDERSVNDIVVLNDFPWQHPPEEYAIAITGKAFNHLLNDAT
jgi:hypothetical protein